MTKSHLIIDNGLLRAAALFASTDPHRHYIGGVYIETVKDKTRIVATDGKTMFAAQINMAGTVPVKTIIPLHLVKKLPTTKRGQDHVDVVIDGQDVSLSYNGTTVSGQAVDGTFPDYRRVVPQEFNGELTQFDPDQLAAFKKAGKLMGADGVPYVFHNGSGPALVRIVPNDHSRAFNCFGLIMPMVTHKVETIQPYHSWIRD